mmetsp:Transcript_6966/g.12878  ORF Transcript_6966/g.12878 Transcript_6966/m.12878 type:complete len:342 (+) Transcript_6966:160-1185(+)
MEGKDANELSSTRAMPLLSPSVAQERFKTQGEIGGGAFGVVRRAIDVETGRVVAIKVIHTCRQGPTWSQDTEESEVEVSLGAFREIVVLTKLLGPHPNIVHALAVFGQGSNVCLVLEMADCDLKAALRQKPFSEAKAKYVIREIARGLAHCHSIGIMHRDIKPSNILIWSNGSIKLADFGLARSFRCKLNNRPKESSLQFSHQVATRWYRAPELLYGCRTYSEKVDIFSLGAILAEILLGAPIFPGENDLDQIYRVSQVLGSVDPVALTQEMGSVPDLGKVEFQHLEPAAEVFQQASASQQLIDDLVYPMLDYLPSMRPSAQQVCESLVLFMKPYPAWTSG